MIRLTPAQLGRLYIGFREHRGNARARRISFELSWEQWLNVWMKSGHVLERGCGRGKYVMSRFGDRGSYALGNIEIIPHPLNVSLGQSGKVVSEETRRKISVALKARAVAKAARCKMSRAKKRHKKTTAKLRIRVASGEARL